MVADEIVLLTRSLQDGSPALEWLANSDGTYSIRELARELAVGSRVILRLREEASAYSEFGRLFGHVQKYGGYLEHEVSVLAGGQMRHPARASGLNPLWSIDSNGDDEAPVWALGFRPLDAFSISDPECGLEAVAYILPEPVPDLQRGAHRLYIKRMFVADRDVHVVPRWASFAHLVVNSTRLSPTASREMVSEDETFHATQRVIAERLREYLHGLARMDPALLAQIVAVHDASLRRLAREDDSFFKLVIDLLPFETSRGTVRFGQYRAENTTVRLARTLDHFRSCSAIAAAQGLTVFNGGYSHHSELLERAVASDPSLTLEIVDARALLDGISKNRAIDPAPFRRLLEVAAEVLSPFECRPMVKSFEPADIPAVFAEGPERTLIRSIDAARKKSEGFWTEILDALDDEIGEEERAAFLCFNVSCPLVRSLCKVRTRSRLEATVRVLYVQSLLLGRQPLSEAETRSFSDSLALILGSPPDEKGK